MAEQNSQIKDGVGNQFTLRTKDISPLSDNSYRRSMVYATPYPLDYDGGGAFQVSVKSGTMAAGLAANAPILSFRFISPNLTCVVKRVRMSAWSLGTGFTAGVALFDIFTARSFSIVDSGGNVAAIAGATGKLRTSMQAGVATLVSANTAVLTVGTRTLDNLPIDSITAAVGTATNTIFLARTSLLDMIQGEHPVVLANQEGLIVQATVPATGTWQFAATVEWSETPYY